MIWFAHHWSVDITKGILLDSLPIGGTASLCRKDIANLVIEVIYDCVLSYHEPVSLKFKICILYVEQIWP